MSHDKSNLWRRRQSCRSFALRWRRPLCLFWTLRHVSTGRPFHNPWRQRRYLQPHPMRTRAQHGAVQKKFNPIFHRQPMVFRRCVPPQLLEHERPHDRCLTANDQCALIYQIHGFEDMISPVFGKVIEMSIALSDTCRQVFSSVRLVHLLLSIQLLTWTVLQCQRLTSLPTFKRCARESQTRTLVSSDFLCLSFALVQDIELVDVWSGSRCLGSRVLFAMVSSPCVVEDC